MWGRFICPLWDLVGLMGSEGGSHAPCGTWWGVGVWGRFIRPLWDPMGLLGVCGRFAGLLCKLVGEKEYKCLMFLLVSCHHRLLKNAMSNPSSMISSKMTNSRRSEFSIPGLSVSRTICWQGYLLAGLPVGP